MISSLSPVWLTNLWTPYRHAVWTAMSRRGIKPTVVLLAEVEANRSWIPPEPTDYTICTAPGPSFERGEYKGYAGPLRPVWPGSLLRLPGAALVCGGWESPAYWRAAIMARLSGCPRVQFNESTLLSARFSRGPAARVRELMFTSAEAVLTVGSASTAAAIRYGASQERIYEARNAVDVATFSRGTKSRGPLPRNLRFLYLGQLVQRKGVDSAIRAFAQLEGNHRLSIIGRGPELPALQALVAERHLQHRVTFRDHVEAAQVPIVLSEHDCLVLPSHNEVWGLVVNEALHSGLCVVVTEQAGVAPDLTATPRAFVVPATVRGLEDGMRSVASHVGVKLAEGDERSWTPEAFAAQCEAALQAALRSRKK